ncbi:MAG: hypothetical protein ACYDBV_08605 [Nitrospiria bacterium]
MTRYNPGNYTLFNVKSKEWETMRGYYLEYRNVEMFTAKRQYSGFWDIWEIKTGEYVIKGCGSRWEARESAIATIDAQYSNGVDVVAFIEARLPRIKANIDQLITSRVIN